MLESLKGKKAVVAAIGVTVLLLFALVWHGQHKYKEYYLEPSNLPTTESDQDSIGEKASTDEKLLNILQAIKKVSDNVNLLGESLRLGFDQFQAGKDTPGPSTVVLTSIESSKDPAGVAQLKLDLESIAPIPAIVEDQLHDKWIVVTSIFSPTEDMKKLAAIPGWKMVVVGDGKTPADWSLDGVTFLSIAVQEKSPFETAAYLKRGVYQRKNMGYLYAIQHGAKYIYDTDDDNHPYDGKVVFDDLMTEKEYLVYNEGRNYYNTFAHFGQSTIWPRGYPLNHISEAIATNYKKCTKVRPLVQQGVVDGDPDIDAVQRLTRKDSDVKFDVLFDKNAPPVILPDRSFAPYNSQNTIHHYDAFFSLLLPQTVTFRVNDIWRSYITQRLMWDIGGHLAYYPPSAYQDRTPHDFLQDFIEEDDLYKKCLPMTKFLLEWEGKETEMHKRYFELVKELHALGILGDLDVKLARAWIRDLVRIGYSFPTRRAAEMECIDENIKYLPKEQGSMYLRVGKQVVDIFRAARSQAARPRAKGAVS